MPTIEITEEQRDRLENVRGELEEHRLGPYGVVRTVDAVEFLLDHYEEGVGLAEDASGDGVEVADAGAGGGDPAKEAHEAEEAEDEEEAEEGEAEDREEAEDEEDEAEEDEDEEDEAESKEEDGEEAEGEGEDSTSGRLNAMMQLLDDYDDKWEEDPDAEGGKYAVTLPDGVTENVRTKDDVRALLFKHY